MRLLKLGLLAALVSVSTLSSAATRDFLNVSYDPTRELYEDVNQQFGHLFRGVGEVLNVFISKTFHIKCWNSHYKNLYKFVVICLNSN